MNRELLTFPELWFQINPEICARPRKSEKVTMKLNARSYWLALLLLMMSAVPAVAQFEVDPDHVGDDPSNSRQVARSNSMTDLKLQDLKMQIGEQKKLLASYQDRLRQKSALASIPGQPSLRRAACFKSA
jgi:hypothetical protein